MSSSKAALSSKELMVAARRTDYYFRSRLDAGLHKKTLGLLIAGLFLVVVGACNSTSLDAGLYNEDFELPISRQFLVVLHIRAARLDAGLHNEAIGLLNSRQLLVMVRRYRHNTRFDAGLHNEAIGLLIALHFLVVVRAAYPCVTLSCAGLDISFDFHSNPLL